MLGRAYLGPGDESICTAHAFAIYAIIAQQQGSKIIEVAEKNFTADVDAILAAVTPKTKIVWLANPNNPTGTYLPYDEVKRLHGGLPSHVLLVLDGAYAEFVRKNDYASGIELVSQFEQRHDDAHVLEALRACRPARGLGLCAAHVVDAIERVRMPFNVNLPAQAAAIAALEDEAFTEESLAHNDRELPRLVAGAEGAGPRSDRRRRQFLRREIPRDQGQDRRRSAGLT
jgi:histidinol-phosphate aminotransferase